MAELAPRTEFRHWDFDQVHRWGPTIDERVVGSPALRRWQLACRQFCGLLARIEFDGLERVPAQGPAILAVNHTSAMDGALLFGFVDRVVSFIVKAEAFEPAGGLAGRVLMRGAQLPVRRGYLDPAPVRLTLTMLDRGAVLGICPEGSRGDGRVRLAQPGVGYFALKTGTPVLPVAVHGAAAMAHHRAGPRPLVRVTVGAPIRLGPAVPGPLNRRRWLAATEQVRCRLAELVQDTDPNSAVATA
ncbi:MAG: lysophospholipid acyltransferase family protein [Jatrophihabitans sp.]